jgi:hypothetical protein
LVFEPSSHDSSIVHAIDEHLIDTGCLERVLVFNVARYLNVGATGETRSPTLQSEPPRAGKNVTKPESETYVGVNAPGRPTMIMFLLAAYEAVLTICGGKPKCSCAIGILSFALMIDMAFTIDKYMTTIATTTNDFMMR